MFEAIPQNSSPVSIAINVSFMDVLDHARALNALLTLPRLERILHIYKTWVNVEGVEGGLALSRRELECVLEFPPSPEPVDFLFSTFQCSAADGNSVSRPRVDLLTLLTTAAVLAQGSLADKAHFVFSLVDLDTEDDIVEAELALVISTCCNGLNRLKIFNGEVMEEIDALAIAYEAFEFVELEDGDKMTFAMFMKWLVFHPRPTALLQRISCLFSMCDLVGKMKTALQERQDRPTYDQYIQYTDGPLDENAENKGLKIILGPVVGCVSPHCARVLLECDAEGDVTCVLVDRLTCEEYFVVKRVKACRPAILTITELSPGRVYDISFRGLLNEATGVLQTSQENLPAFRIIFVSEDRFLDGTTEQYGTNGGEVIEPLPSHIVDVVTNLLPSTKTLQADVTVHIGCIVALAHDLGHKYSILIQEGQVVKKSALQNSIRECIRQHWNAPANKQLLASGAHWFSSIGMLRTLLTQEDVPVTFLREVRQILAEYEQVGDGRVPSILPPDKYMYRLQRGVAVIMIDTLEAILENIDTMPYAQLQERLLTASQWEALEYWLNAEVQQTEEIDHADYHANGPFNAVAEPNTLVIVCDSPLISQRGEGEEIKRMWLRRSRRKSATGMTCSQPCLADAGALSWSLYPNERARLLRLVFGKLQKTPKFHVVFTCSGAFASRSTITDKVTNLSFEQIVVGSVSKIVSPSRMDQQEAAANNKPLASVFQDVVGDYIIKHEIPTGATAAQQYCTIEAVPHPLGPTSDAKFYLQNQGDARLVVGPVIGRITPRTARILIEVDRSVSRLLCVLSDSVTSQSFSVQANVEAFTPTILKVEGLHPGTRYAIGFQGLMESKDTVLGYVLTPSWVALASEWLVVNRNSLTDFVESKHSNSSSTALQPNSQWPRILAHGTRAFTTQVAGEVSHRNGDTLGDHRDDDHPNFNPWHRIEDEYLSEPLASPQLLIHLGGQVHMSRAFTDAELYSLIVRLAKQVEDDQYDEDDPNVQQLRSELRHRMQEVYRTAWGVPPMKRLLGYSSNLMLLNEDADLYFSLTNIRDAVDGNQCNKMSDTTLSKVVAIFRGLAFELWQFYQNQLWVDLAERELKYGSKSSGNKTAFSTTYGINRIVVANVSHEVHEFCSAEAERPSSIPLAQVLDDTSSGLNLNLFSPSSWKVIDEALDTSTATPDTELAQVRSTRPKNPVQQLVLVISVDLMAGGGRYSALRPEIVKLLEKLFAWKYVDRVRREVTLICCRANGSTISFEVTDEKMTEKLTLTCIGSVSEPRDLLHRDQKKSKGAVPTAASAPISKGHFSKRFSYRSTTITSSNAAALAAVGTNVSLAERGQQVATSSEAIRRTSSRCRTFVSYRFITDFRRGLIDETAHFFPAVSLPKAVVGPVIGRMILTETPRAPKEEPLAEGDPGDPVKMMISVPILLEINADARVACIVTDILANEDVRVVQALTRYHPHVFYITSLVPERRYVYRFEGIANSDQRCGNFHTPPSSPTTFNFVAVSSNFPEQMEESSDSLWAAIKTRAQVSWCGLDAIFHLGGQVPMHEATLECFEWVRRELKRKGKPLEIPQPEIIADNLVNPTSSVPAQSSAYEVTTDAFEKLLRRKVRQRLQQRYRLCWNMPNVREALAHTSNWFLRSQSDVAPFFRNHEVLYTKAACLVLSEAKRVVADYQLKLMQRNVGNNVRDHAEVLEQSSPNITDGASSSDTPEGKTPEQPERNHLGSAKVSPLVPSIDISMGTEDRSKDNIPRQSEEVSTSVADKEIDTAQFIQTGEVGIFMCDMRSTPANDIVTCNNRLLTPLTRQERAIIGEKQWLYLEKALKKKSVMAFVLCLELPLILTDANHVDVMREDAANLSVRLNEEEASGRWKLYDRQTIFQHWVSCRRQLEQLLTILFRWKAKRSGREVVVLSGGMRVGLDSLLQDRDTQLTIRSFTVGPLTARVEPSFEGMPLDGTACPTFIASESQRDEQFTFSHSLVTSKNYLLAHIGIARELIEQPEKIDEAATEIITATVETEFIVDDDAVDASHPVNQYRRFPSWWADFVPMGKIVFWDDTVTMRSQSDEEVIALARYLHDGREFTAALEVLFEKHHFAEAARMEELRSKHRRRQRGPEELRASLRAVFAELWKVLPDTHRRQVVYFQDKFVFDFLLGYIAPTLFEDDGDLDDDTERPPLEFAAFSTLCRDFIFNSCVLHLSLCMHQEDERRKIALQRADAKRQTSERTAQRAQQEKEQAEEAAKLEKLRLEDPEAYAKHMLAEQEQKLREKRAKVEAAREQRKAEKMRDIDEELAIAKEQRKLDKLAAEYSDKHEYQHRRELLAVRARKLQERKRHREAEEARRQAKKEKTKKANAAHQQSD